MKIFNDTQGNVDAYYETAYYGWQNPRQALIGLCDGYKEAADQLVDYVLAAHNNIKAPPHNSRLGAQAACRAKIFRDIFQKCSPIRQGLPALFGSSHKKFFGTLHHLGLCGVALKLETNLYFQLFLTIATV